MGKESWAPKERVCKHCGGVLYCDAERLKGHAALCKRASEDWYRDAWVGGAVIQC